MPDTASNAPGLSVPLAPSVEALLWTFHNAKTGICFPSYEKIAEAGRCARSTAAEAIKALEAAGLLTWVNRLVRVRERCRDILGGDGSRVRVMRTSNGYAFVDPQGAGLALPSWSKSENPPGTRNQVTLLARSEDTKIAFELDSELALSLARWGRGVRGQKPTG